MAKNGPKRPMAPNDLKQPKVAILLCVASFFADHLFPTTLPLVPLVGALVVGRGVMHSCILFSHFARSFFVFLCVFPQRFLSFGIWDDILQTNPRKCIISSPAYIVLYCETLSLLLLHTCTHATATACIMQTCF